MKRILELSDLVNDIWQCTINPNSHYFLDVVQYTENTDFDTIPHLNDKEEFWELWQGNNIEERIINLLSIPLFETDSINEYQTKKRLNQIKPIFLEMTRQPKLLLRYVETDTEWKQLETYIKLLDNVGDITGEYQKMAFDDGSETTQYIYRNQKHEPEQADGNKPEQADGKAEPHATKWLIGLCGNREEAELIVNKLKAITRLTPKKIIRIFEEIPNFEKLYDDNMKDLADDLTECTGLKLTKNNLQTYKKEAKERAEARKKAEREEEEEAANKRIKDARERRNLGL